MTLIGQIAHLLFPVWHQKYGWKKTYGEIAEIFDDRDFIFMNHGYEPSDLSDPILIIEKNDRKWDVMIQLYYKTANQVPLQNKDVLEVGCGRGGGCYIIKKYLGARNVKGLDLSPQAIARNLERFKNLGIEFVCGSADKLPDPDESFDAVLNVESSHHYPDIEKFIAETHRVLRKQGHLLLTDMGTPDRMRMLEKQFLAANYSIVSERDITSNVIAGIQKTVEYYESAVKKYAQNAIQKNTWINMARTPGTAGYNAFVSGEEIYKVYCLRK